MRANEILWSEGGFPSEWSFKPIEEGFEFTSKPKALRLSEHKYPVPVLPMEAIQIGRRITDSFQYRDPGELNSGTYVEHGDLIIAKITPSFENGKQTIVFSPDSFVHSTTEVIPVRARSEHAITEYLYFVLLHPAIRSTLAGRMEGSTGRQRLSKDVLKAFPIPLPPTEEQKKIAAVLSTVQRAIEAQERIIATTTELKKALMQKLFTEGLHGEPQKQTEIGPVPDSWRFSLLSELASVKAGGTPSRKVPEYWENGKIPWVKTGEINYVQITSTEERITSLGLENSSAYIVPAGTMVMAMYGQGVTRGKVAILGINAATNQACVAISPYKTSEVTTSYLYRYFEYTYHELREFAHGANQKNLSATLVKSFPVYFPDVAIQEDISNILEALDSRIQKADREVKTLTELFNTLLNQLMTAQIRVNDIDLSFLDDLTADGWMPVGEAAAANADSTKTVARGEEAR